MNNDLRKYDYKYEIKDTCFINFYSGNQKNAFYKIRAIDMLG
jgi:hypothetical protein